ncbi:MAG: 50S ribosomal protein L23 [Thermoanaerobaculia bacterium]
MSTLDLRGTLRRPIITEKSTAAIEHLNAYVFQVDPAANKLQIKRAVEEQFNVKVVKVNTRRRFGKRKRLGMTIGYTQPVKEAIVTLRRGDKIDVY